MKERQQNEVLWMIYHYILFEHWPHQSYLEGGSKKVGARRWEEIGEETKHFKEV